MTKKDVNNIDVSPHDVVLLLNSMLALDPSVVLELMSHRPYITNDDFKDLMHMDGNRISFLGIINNIIHDSGYMIGADCEMDGKDMQYVKFFHLLERESKDAKK